MQIAMDFKKTKMGPVETPTRILISDIIDKNKVSAFQLRTCRTIAGSVSA